MEDILASIRRIIADDKSVSLMAEMPPHAEPVFEKPEVMPASAEPAHEPRFFEVSETPAPPVKLPEPLPQNAEGVALPADDMADIIDLANHPDVIATRLVTEFNQPQSDPFAMLDNSDAVASDPLASPLTDAAVASSFDALAKSVMLDNKPLIEQLTRDMLRPMLKTWLDDNLPVMVEKLVRAEIERVSRGGR